MKKLLLILTIACAQLVIAPLRAENYPSKPITLVAVFGPGSASDTICRVIAQPLSAALKETVIVENRPGANGALAALYVARAAPDGATLLMATNSPLSAVPFLMTGRVLAPPQIQSSPSSVASASRSISTSHSGASPAKLSAVVRRHSPRGWAASVQKL